jgi:O-acetyl-ADP-ribose deacetylase (regulator of RNase III)
MNLQLVEGDLLLQDVDVIVNAWNCNIIPWWLLLPQGVSGAILQGSSGVLEAQKGMPVHALWGQTLLIGKLG